MYVRRLLCALAVTLAAGSSSDLPPGVTLPTLAPGAMLTAPSDDELPPLLKEAIATPSDEPLRIRDTPCGSLSQWQLCVEITPLSLSQRDLVLPAYKYPSLGVTYSFAQESVRDKRDCQHVGFELRGRVDLCIDDYEEYIRTAPGMRFNVDSDKRRLVQVVDCIAHPYNRFCHEAHDWQFMKKKLQHHILRKAARQKVIDANGELVEGVWFRDHRLRPPQCLNLHFSTMFLARVDYRDTPFAEMADAYRDAHNIPIDVLEKPAYWEKKPLHQVNADELEKHEKEDPRAKRRKRPLLSK